MFKYDRFIVLALLILLPVLVLMAMMVPLATAISFPDQSFPKKEAKTLPSGAMTVNTLDDELNNDGDCSLREASRLRMIIWPLMTARQEMLCLPIPSHSAWQEQSC